MSVWVPVASADSAEGLKSATSWLEELEPGTRGQVKVEGLPWGSAKVFDLPLAEQVFGQHLVPHGAKVIDCHEENGVGYVEFEVTGTPLHLILLGIAAALIALGFLAVIITVCVKLSQVNPTMFSWQIWLVIIAAVVGFFVMVVLVARSGRLQAGPVQVGK